jgi:cytochrome c biogenesis protein CcmG, thiol:disulfide interchange protein DsbE
MNRLIFIVPLLLFGGIAVAFGIGLTKDPSIIPSQLIDRPLPAFDLPGVEAGAPGFASADLATGTPKLLNVFASWCTSCRVEHPLLMQLKAEGVPIYGLDWKDKPVDGAGYLAQYGSPYLATANDENGRAGIDLGVTGTPETFVIDGAGRVRYKHVGPITPEVWAEVLQPLMTRLAAEA